MKKQDYIGSDVVLARKNPDEYIAYLEHKMLTQCEGIRCCECERIVTDSDAIRFETGDFSCPDCSEKHTRRLEREQAHWDACKEAANQAYDSKESAIQINQMINAADKVLGR